MAKRVIRRPVKAAPAKAIAKPVVKAAAPVVSTSPATWPHEDVAALNAFYGDPRGVNGEVNPKWEAANIGFFIPPYPMFYSDGKRSPMTKIRVHKKCIATFQAAFADALQTLGHDYIVEHRLDITGGAFCYRLMRGGNRLSVHSWACAIDLDPAHNPFPHKWVANMGMIDSRFAEILQKHGFTWRGANSDIDPMHFQLATR